MPVIQLPPGSVVATRPQRQVGEAEHDPQPGADVTRRQPTPSSGVEPALQRGGRRPGHLTDRRREGMALAYRPPQDVRELAERQDRGPSAVLRLPVRYPG